MDSRHTGLVAPQPCGIFPDQGWNLCSLHWQVDSYPLDHQGNPQFLSLVLLGFLALSVSYCVSFSSL